MDAYPLLRRARAIGLEAARHSCSWRILASDGGSCKYLPRTLRMRARVEGKPMRKNDFESSHGIQLVVIF